MRISDGSSDVCSSDLAAALGCARRALDEATRRAIERRLGEGRLADNPITQSKLAEMVLDVDASALLIYRAAWLRDVKGQRNSREAALAKLHATEREIGRAHV